MIGGRFFRSPRESAGNTSNVGLNCCWLPGRFIIGLSLLLLACDPSIAAPTITLVNPTVRLDYGSADGEAKLAVQIDGLDAGQLQDANLVGSASIRDDTVSSAATKIAITKLEETSPASATGRRWFVYMKVAGLPANTSQKRDLKIDVGGRSTTLEYTLTNKAVETFSWTVKGPASIALEDASQAIPITISVGPVPATGLTLAGPYLSEKTTSALLAPNGLCLAREATGPCLGQDPKDRSLPANSLTQLWVVGAKGVGQFTGTLTIAANEKPEGESLSLTVFSTTTMRQALGILTIFVSAVLTWFVTVFARNLVNRNQMLLPVARLTARLDQVAKGAAGNPTGKPTTFLTIAINRVGSSLSRSELEALGLPGRIPLSSSAAPATGQTDAYRAHVQGAADWVAALEAIYQGGLAVIWSRWSDPAQRAGIQAATVQLDALVQTATAPPLVALRQSIDGIVNGVGIAPRGAAAPLQSEDQLTLQIMQLSFVTWVVVLLGTTIVGSIALVLNNSFGSLYDFVKCAAWGLGLPIGGQALSATFGSVGTTLGISMPK